jgi:hypothetical protein
LARTTCAAPSPRSLARRGVDPIEAAQIAGHSPDVWARYYARSFGKAQRAEARRRMLAHGFGTAEDDANSSLVILPEARKPSVPGGKSVTLPIKRPGV